MVQKGNSPGQKPKRKQERRRTAKRKAGEKDLDILAAIGADQQRIESPSMAKKTRNATTVSPNRACSDGRSGKDECSGHERTRTRYRDSPKTGSFCNGHRSRKELLRLWGT